MIRNYRDIGKPASVLMYTGAGKSQDRGGSVVTESFLDSEMRLSVNGGDWIEVGKVNQVNSVFLSSVVAMTNEFGFAGNDATTSYFRAKVSKFSLLEDEYDVNMNQVYSSICDMDLQNMVVKGTDLLNTRVSFSGTVQRSGVVRSAGFDAVTKELNILPTIKMPWRKMDVTFPERDLPPTGTTHPWVFDPYKQRIMCLRQDFIGRVVVADFDPLTRTLGSFSEIANIPVNGTTGVASDGQNFVVYHTYPGFIHYLDLITDEVTMIPLSAIANPDTNLVWDYELEKLRSFKRADNNVEKYDGYTIDLNGVVEFNTGGLEPTFPSSGSSGTMLFSSGDYIVDWMNMIYSINGQTATKLVQPITTRTQKEQFLFDPAGTIVRGTLKTANSKLVGLNFETYRIAEHAMTLLEMPNISLSAGDNVTIEYTFKMSDIQ